MREITHGIDASGSSHDDRPEYAKMASDAAREAEALEWCEALFGDLLDPSEEDQASP